MKVIFFDGNEAVSVIKDGLKPWMQKGDRLIWFYWSPSVIEKGGKPDIAIVCNEDGFETDARARIVL